MRRDDVFNARYFVTNLPQLCALCQHLASGEIICDADYIWMHHVNAAPDINEQDLECELINRCLSSLSVYSLHTHSLTWRKSHRQADRWTETWHLTPDSCSRLRLYTRAPAVNAELLLSPHFITLQAFNIIIHIA